MLRVTVDVFSGRPNPQWIVAFDDSRTLLQSIANTPEVIEHADAATLGLGYRGLKIELLSDDLYREMRLPDSFRVVGKTPRGSEVVDRILHSAISKRSLQDFKNIKGDDIFKFVPQADKELAFKVFKPVIIDTDRLKRMIEIIKKFIDWLRKGGCTHEEIPFDAAFWNDPAHVAHNNCYNFATNRRTDTFAQPGRASGHQATTIDCNNVRVAAISDGAIQALPCPPDEQAPRYLVALVQAPVFSSSFPYPDYHWYRRCSDGFWAHKPGGLSARNYDNSYNTIYDPESCDRGPYINFCGYLYTQKKMVVS
jgi:hypothetical protein